MEESKEEGEEEERVNDKERLESSHGWKSPCEKETT